MAKALPLGGSPGGCKNTMSLHACQYIKCYFLTTATCAGHVREFRGATLPSAIWLRIERLDTREAYGEERVVLVGMSGRFLLIFVYTRCGESLRIGRSSQASVTLPLGMASVTLPHLTHAALI